MEWEYSILNRSILFYRPLGSHPVFMLVGAEHSKCTGQFLKELMSMPGNSSYYRLLTIDHKINFDQRVQLLASIYRYAVINFWFQFRCSPAYLVLISVKKIIKIIDFIKQQSKMISLGRNLKYWLILSFHHWRHQPRPYIWWPLPGGKTISAFNPSIQPLSPPFKWANNTPWEVCLSHGELAKSSQERCDMLGVCQS